MEIDDAAFALVVEGRVRVSARAAEHREDYWELGCTIFRCGRSEGDVEQRSFVDDGVDGLEIVFSLR